MSVHVLRDLRNEANLDVSLSVPHYNGQHGHHYNMNDHTSSLDDTFFAPSSPGSSPLQRSFRFESSSSSSSDDSFVSNFDEKEDQSVDSSSSSSSFDFFESHSSSSSSESLRNAFDCDDDSDVSMDNDDDDNLDESGFVSASPAITQSMEMTECSQAKLRDENNVRCNMNVSDELFNDSYSYWDGMLTCSRNMQVTDGKLDKSYFEKVENQGSFVKHEVVLFGDMETEQVETLNPVSPLSQMVEDGNGGKIGMISSESQDPPAELDQSRDLFAISCVPQQTSSNLRIAEIAITADITTHFEPSNTNSSHGYDDGVNQIDKDGATENTNTENEDPPADPDSTAFIFEMSCKSTQLPSSVRREEVPFELAAHDTNTPNGIEHIQRPICSYEDISQNTPVDALDFGLLFPLSAQSISPSYEIAKVQTSQNSKVRSSLPKKSVAAKRQSVIPNLDAVYSHLLDDIPARQKELIASIMSIFDRLSQLELEGDKLSLQIKTQATWDICVMENDILTRQTTPEDSLKTVHYEHKNGRHRFLVILFLLSEIFKLLSTNSCTTKRELYYRDPQLTHNQRSVDLALRDICFLLKADLWELNVFSSSKGIVAGPLKFRSKHQEMVDCFNSLGTQIPADVNGLLEITLDAEMVLIVEKDTVFRRLLDDGILMRLPKKVLLVTSKGYPDVGTRLLLHKLWNKYRTPMYALVDADPYGIEIYCVYKFGSLALSHQSHQLAVPSIRWLGLRPSHIALLDLKPLPLNDRDRARIRELLKRPYVGRRGCELERELNLLQETNGKAEIEALADISVDYLINEYLPNQLKLCR